MKPFIGITALFLVVLLVFVVGNVTTAAQSGSVDTDRAALVDFYNATDGANWTNNDNWLTDEPLGEWYGVKTDGDGRVNYLSFEQNQLSGQIPASLGNLSNLEILYLSYNRLSGQIPASLGRLSNLTELHIGANQLTGTIPPDLGRLNNLEGLFLGYNQLTGAIPSDLGRLTNLTDLWVNQNRLIGTLPSELGSLSNLERLYLHNNQLTGEIPVALGNLSNLERLILRHNRLSGGIPSSLGNLANLEYLTLRDNLLTGGIPIALGNLTNLQHLYLSENQLSDEIPAALGNLANLRDLSLRNNQLTGGIPATLGNLSNLEYLSLRDNQLSGGIPAILGNLSNLERLFLRHNRLSGCIPDGLQGVPENDLDRLGLLFCSAAQEPAAAERAVLVALYNATGGTDWIHSDGWLSDEPIGDWHGVRTNGDGRVTRLSLNENQLSGQIPPSLGQLSDLEYLSLRNNQLTGGIPVALGNLSNLTWLHLGVNQLSGVIPSSLGRLTNLEKLVLGHNQLTGTVPSELGSLSNLTELWLGGNQLSGTILASLGNLSNLQLLELSDNQLSGDIPATLGNLSNLEVLWLHNNRLSGEIPDTLGSLSNLEELYLGANELGGEIPPELTNLANLQVLALYYNRLSGEIPVALGNLSDLQLLWLHNNQLSGEIPDTLGSLSNLEELYLGANQLSGCIPDGLQGVPTNDLHRLGLLFCGEAEPPQPVSSSTVPSNVEATVSGSEVTITWTAAPGAAGHGVLLFKDDFSGDPIAGFSRDPIRAFPASSPHTFSGVPDGNYIAYIIAIDDGGDYEYAVSGLVTVMAAAASSVDRPALVALYRATDGDNWSNSQLNDRKWLVDDPNSSISDWYGVRTDGDGRVVNLWLSENNLSGAIPTALKDLNHLEGLGLRGNNLQGQIPDELGTLANLTALFLGENLLNGPIPTELGNLTNLTKLHLQDNGLTGAIPTELGNLTNLSHLSLRSNELDGPIPASLGNLRNLEGLWLYGNDLNGEIPPELGRLSNLAHLYLQHNELNGTIPTALGRLSNLTDLDLSSNQLRGSIPAALGNLTNLRGLWLSDNHLTGLIPAEMGSLTNLDQYLQLGGTNQLIGCLPRPWQDLRAENDLDTLNLSFCSIETVELVPPSNLRAQTGLNAGQVILSWTPSANVNVYQIAIFHNGQELTRPRLHFWGDAREGLITGLEPDQEYDFAVAAGRGASGSEVWSAWTDRVNAAAGQIQPPGKVSNLTAEPGPGRGEVTLRWTPGANATVHQISIRPGCSTGEEEQLQELEDNAGETTVTRLDTLRDNCFKVRAGRGPSENRIWSQWSRLAISKAGEALGPLGTASNLEATPGPGVGEVTLRWEPGDNATVHQVAWRKGSENWTYQKVEVNDNRREATMTGLEQKQEYSFHVRAGQGISERENWSAWSNVANAIAPFNHVADQKALLAFYEATKKDSDWETIVKEERKKKPGCTFGDANALLSNWCGVITNDQGLGRVIIFRLRDYGHLQGEIPPELGNLTDLIRLDLSGNRLSGRLPTSLGNLVNLTYLDLSNNRSGGFRASGGFKGQLPLDLARNKTLTHIDISHNLFSGDLDVLLGAFNERESGPPIYLDIGHNKWKTSKASGGMVSGPKSLIVEEYPVSEDELLILKALYKEAKATRTVLSELEEEEVGKLAYRAVYGAVNIGCKELNNDECTETLEAVGFAKGLLDLRKRTDLLSMYYSATVLDNPLVSELIDSAILGLLNGWSIAQVFDNFAYKVPGIAETKERWLDTYYWNDCVHPQPKQGDKKYPWCQVCGVLADSGSSTADRITVIKWCDKNAEKFLR